MLTSIVTDTQSADETEIVFVYSGHGFYKKVSGDHHHNQAECIALLGGLFWDYEFHDTFIDRLDSSVTMWALFDSCNSGSILNLPFSYNHALKKCNSEYVYPRVKDVRQQPRIVCFAGCGEREQSAGGNKPTDHSLMTYVIQPCLMQNTALSQADLFVKVHKDVHHLRRAQHPVLSLSHCELAGAPLQ